MKYFTFYRTVHDREQACVPAETAEEAWQLLQDGECDYKAEPMDSEPWDTCTVSEESSREEKEIELSAMLEDLRKTLTFTVLIREPGNTGTTHISSHQAPTLEEAVKMAKAEVQDDWELTGPAREKLHVLGVLEGDVKVLEWDDAI